MSSIAFYTLGCKLNFSETSTIGRQAKEQGFDVVEFDQSADIYVINTCSVTENADKKCKKVVRDAKKQNPDSSVIVIGCYAQLKPQEIIDIEGVDMVLGAAEKFNLIEHLNKLKDERKVVYNANIKETNVFVPGFSVGDRTRSFLKVQDGCDYFCSFCTIPLARGKSRSNTVAETIKVANQVAATDIKEVVLTGVNIGDFGVDTDETFFDLVLELDKVAGIERFRISSIEPNLLENRIIEFVANSRRFVPHFHVPLQSGSNEILHKMRRKYERELYADRVATIKKLLPHACIGVDVIVGFPGESDEHFLETYNFLKDLDVSYLHVFPYSERANTTAKKLPEKVNPKTKNERADMLRILSDKKRMAFYNQHLGSHRTVLFEAEEKGDFMYGFTDNYVKVKAAYDQNLVNQLVDVELQNIDNDGVVSCVLVSELV
ncbi:MAG: tRNA (N(6)-L-threonylcarbamoyladenosine(37)-C(2))-methylthiotransferase MtaB [Flavobacteriales bacterium]|nr:tRNA (N(6)-L-threonylcarbamoyladenosine(37)-C(2))-methylthiotransferase MtaB [Flavobacteriales bacterium]